MSNGIMCCPGVFLCSVVFVKVGFSHLFAVYVDDFIERLNDFKLGCFIGDLQLGCIMYTDDLIQISASVSILQKMIVICEKEAEYIYMKFNSTKSVVIRMVKDVKIFVNILSQLVQNQIMLVKLNILMFILCWPNILN